MAVDPYSTALQGLGAVGSFFAGRSAAKSQKELNRAQRDIIRQQSQLFSTAQPYYGQLLQAYAGRAGVGQNGLVQTGPSSYQSSVPGALGSNYGSPEDQLRLRQAEEDVNRYFTQQANQLRHQFGQGAASGTLEAALARLGGQQAQQLAGFRRQLAIQAPQEQERRLANLTGLLGLGFGQGSQAAAGYGQQAARYGQEAGQNFGTLGNILQNYQYQQALQGLGGQGGSSLEPYPYSADTYSPAFDPTGPYDPWAVVDPRRLAMGR